MHASRPPARGTNQTLQSKVILQSARLPFLALSPACVLLGLATALETGTAIHYGIFALILLAAVSAHISVNTLNEYCDYKSGLDFLTRRTPFSGGSGALVAHPQMASRVLLASASMLLFTLSIGVYFVWLRGLPVALIGVVGIVLVLAYTTWLNQFAWACLLAPGLGFGLLMVLGTHYVLAGEFSPLAWLAALIPFFLVNNLLLLNQYPDVEADRLSGRRHFPIAHGLAKSTLVYGAFLLATCLTLAVGIGTGVFPKQAAMSLPPLFFSVFALHGALRHNGNIGSHPAYLGANAAAAVATPLLLAISIMLV